MVWLVQVFLFSRIPGGQVRLTFLVVCSMSFFAVCTLSNSMQADFAFRAAGVAFVLLTVMHFTADFTGREVPASGFHMAKSLALLALSGGRGGVLFLNSQTQTEEIEPVANGVLRIPLRCKCNANRSSHFLPSLTLMGEPVGLADNLETVVEGADFIFQNVQTLERSGDAMDGNLVPWNNGEGFAELYKVLPDISIFQEIFGVEGRGGCQNNILLLAVGS